MKNLVKPYLGLPKGIYVLFFATIVNNMGNFVAPFLTLFLKDKIGLSEVAIGTLIMISSWSGFFGSLIGGKLIDTAGRKKTLIIFQTAAAICYIPCAYMGVSVMIPVLLILSSFFSGIASPVHGTIATDLTDGENRKIAFSLTYLAINIGFAVGPLIAGFLYKHHLKLLFLGDALTTIISVLLVVIYIKETKPNSEQIIASKRAKNKMEQAEEGSLLDALLKRPTLVVFSIITILFFFIFSEFNFGLSLQCDFTFKKEGAKVFGILMTTNAVVVSAFTVFITSLTKKLDSTINMAIGGIFYAIGFGMLFLVNNFYLFIVSAAIWSLGEIMVSTNTSVYLADHTPISHRGRFNSIFPIIRKVGFAFGPFVTGIYIKYLGLKNVWIMIFVLSLVTSFLMYNLYQYDKRKKKMIFRENVI